MSEHSGDPLPESRDLTDPTPAEREQIREQYDEVWVTRTRHHCHLISDCPRFCGDASGYYDKFDPDTKPIAALPGDHLSLCSLCVERWRRNGQEAFEG